MLRFQVSVVLKCDASMIGFISADVTLIYGAIQQILLAKFDYLVDAVRL